MPPATARCSALYRVASSALIRMPPVTPPPSASSEISSPVRPKKPFRIGLPAKRVRPRESGPLRSRRVGGTEYRRQVSPEPALGPQLEALDLAGRGLRQLGPKLDPAWIFVGCQLLLAVILQRAREALAGLVRRLEHHE